METLYKYDFKKELMNMAASCVGLKPNTAKKKISDVFEKYNSIISGSTDYGVDYYHKKYSDVDKKFKTLKRGSIEYIRGETEGTILLKDIEQIEVGDRGVLLITKTGRQITMGEDFKYLKDLF
jgi:hypothetical protein